MLNFWRSLQHIRASVYVYLYLHLHTNLFVSVCVCAHVSVNGHLSICLKIHLSLSIHRYTSTYIFYSHIFINNQNSQSSLTLLLTSKVSECRVSSLKNCNKKKNKSWTNDEKSRTKDLQRISQPKQLFVSILL